MADASQLPRRILKVRRTRDEGDDAKATTTTTTNETTTRDAVKSGATTADRGEGDARGKRRRARRETGKATRRDDAKNDETTRATRDDDAGGRSDCSRNRFRGSRWR